MPQANRTKGVHHVVLKVTDVNHSTGFYEKVLGMKVLQTSDQGSVLADGAGMLCLQRSGRPVAGDRFDENRVGLDHVAFSVASRRELKETVEILSAMGVKTAGIESDTDGQSEYVCFRDPDNIQVEVYVWTAYSSGQEQVARIEAGA